MRSEFAAFLREHQRFVLLSHVDPDGDAIGSALGLAWILRGLDKQAQVLLPGGAPDLYRFLTGADEILSDPGQADPSAAAVVALDATSASRLGDLAPLLDGPVAVANVDHHGDNQRFAPLNLVDATASATALIVWETAKEAGFPVSPSAAESLYAGILTDTGRFTFANTDVRTLAAAAALADAGAAPAAIAQNVYGQRSVSSVRLLGHALETLEVYEGGDVACLHVTDAMLDETGASLEDSEGFSVWARSLAGVKVGVFLREAPDGMIKISFRSNEGVEIDGVAGRFGGGGHPSAAGARVPGPLQAAKHAVLEAISEHLRSMV